MEHQQNAEINFEDTIADTNLEIEEIISTIKIISYALENAKNKNTELKNIDNVLFMLQGKLNSIKNNLTFIQQNVKAG